MGHLSNARWFLPLRRAYNAVCRARLARQAISVPTIRPPGGTSRVLVLGVYLADRPNTAAHLVRRFSESRNHHVDQAWAAIGGVSADPALAAATVEQLDGFVPKFVVMNRLLERHDWRSYDWLVFADDDIVVPTGFLDAYLGLQTEFGFALAQPARTRNSWADHKFCRQQRGLRGRQTRYVEIGPLFSVRKDFAPTILPFDESSGMGWGYDYVWPVLAEKAGAKMGIIDATPVDHSLRDQASAYSSRAAAEQMRDYLARNEHLSKQQAFSVIATH